MSLRYSEIEYKYGADHVDPAEFDGWCRALQIKDSKKIQLEHLKVEGFDAYYRQGGAVVRHRFQPNTAGGGCLTVKYRKSAKSIANRVEIDIFLDTRRSTPDDVTNFLAHTGWRKEFQLFKWASIFTIREKRQPEVTVVLYEITCGKAPKRKFVEVEVEKNEALKPQVALKYLKKWDDRVRKAFSLDKPLNLSLYEIYGKKRYQIRP